MREKIQPQQDGAEPNKADANRREASEELIDEYGAEKKRRKSGMPEYDLKRLEELRDQRQAYDEEMKRLREEMSKLSNLRSALEDTSWGGKANRLFRRHNDELSSAGIDTHLKTEGQLEQLRGKETPMRERNDFLSKHGEALRKQEHEIWIERENIKAKFRVEISRVNQDIEKAQNSILEGEKRIKGMNLEFQDLEEKELISPEQLEAIREKDIEELIGYLDQRSEHLKKLREHQEEINSKLGVVENIEQSAQGRHKNFDAIHQELERDTSFRNGLENLLDAIFQHPELMTDQKLLEEKFFEMMRPYFEKDKDMAQMADEYGKNAEKEVDIAKGLMYKYFSEVFLPLVEDIARNPFQTYGDKFFDRLRIGRSGYLFGSIKRWFGKLRKHEEDNGESSESGAKQALQKFQSLNEVQRAKVKEHIIDSFTDRMATDKFEHRAGIKEIDIKDHFDDISILLESRKENIVSETGGKEGPATMTEYLFDDFYNKELEKVCAGNNSCRDSFLRYSVAEIKDDMNKMQKFLSSKKKLEKDESEEFTLLMKKYPGVVDGYTYRCIASRRKQIASAVVVDVKTSKDILSEYEKERVAKTITLETALSVEDDMNEFFLRSIDTKKLPNFKKHRSAFEKFLEKLFL